MILWLFLFFIAHSCKFSSVLSFVTVLNEANWSVVLKGEWIIAFHAPWCPACRSLLPVWDEFSSWSDDLDMDGIVKVDVTQNPGLSGRFMVTALPTILHVKDGQFRQYQGSRDKDALISFIENKEWKGVAPISGWMHPDSFQMSTVSTFFEISMVLRNIHTQLTEEYGFSSWASYLAFTVVTILVGSLLGLILVFIIDFVFPSGSVSVAESAEEVKSTKDSSNNKIETNNAAVDDLEEEAENLEVDFEAPESDDSSEGPLTEEDYIMPEDGENTPTSDLRHRKLLNQT